ncbi:alpha/beta fold hydrolase [Nocardia sp. NPDC101769]|uniref:alpha/beta fold hydrolase n=1 Tax=Nocardia sp. NPDC101769 TaxID=3364333 RepID=UPI0038233C10
MPDGVGTKVEILRAAEAYAPVVMVWPGIGARGAQYRQFASELRERGCTVVVGELHGQGESRPEPPRTSRYGMHAQVVNDYHLVAEFVRRQFPASSLYVLGHSFGGQLAACYAAREKNIAGLVLIASGTAPVDQMQNVSVLRTVVTKIILGLVGLIGLVPRTTLLGAPTRGLVLDIVRIAKTGRYELGGTDYDYEAGMADSETPMLAITFTGDRNVPAWQTEVLLSKFRSAAIGRRIIDEGLGHFSWRKQPRTVAAAVASFVRDIENGGADDQCQ